MPQAAAPLDPPRRLLCGPGPADVSADVLAALHRPLLGHMDPDFLDILSGLVGMLRAVMRAGEGIVLPLQATGTSGMQAGLTHLLEPGDTVIVGVNGYFGRRIVEIARRLEAEVVAVEADWGHPVSNERLLEALEAHPETRLVVVVYAETSTGVRHSLAELGAALRDRDTLLMADCVTALGGIELDFDGWGLDYAYSCTQKCLGAPPGMSPVAVSQRALERIRARSHPVPFDEDLELLAAYWITRPATYHHTAPAFHIYALYEALREVLNEGLTERFARHAEAGALLQDGLRARGLKLLAEPEAQLPQLTAVRVPEGVDPTLVQTRLLHEHGIEIGGGLGPAAPSMWRLGLMGHNARVDIAQRLLEALDDVLG